MTDLPMYSKENVPWNKLRGKNQHKNYLRIKRGETIQIFEIHK